MQNRLKSKVVWLGVLSQVVLILTLTQVLPVGDIDIIKGVGIAILEILSIVGILNNPTSKETF